jgi:LCP family protein required for cell wall assembly
MRTTLKRGLARGASPNGNGRAVLPPQVLAPVTRYRQPPPPRRGLVGIFFRAVAWLLVAALTVVAGVAGGAYLYVDRSVVAKVVPESEDVIAAAETLDIVPAGEPAIALVIGHDRRLGDEGDTAGDRSDTVMLLRADPFTDAISMLSFPRDLVVDLHCPDGRQWRGRINEAYAECLSEGTLETVRALTGLPVNYLVTVDFRGFKQIVANLGGVWMDVDRRYFNDNSSGGERYATIDLQPGYQKLNGSEALDFVRYRHFDSDLYRLARQQSFVAAFKQALTASFSPTALGKIVGVITDNVEIGKAGNRELSKSELLSYGLFAFDRPQLHQAKIDIGCYRGDAELHADPACIQAAVDEFTSPDVEAPEKATAVALDLKPPTPQPPRPADTTVLVLNGNAVPGAAADTSWQLGQRGFRMLSPPNNLPANAPSSDYYRSKLYYDPEHPEAELAAQGLRPLVGEAEVEPVPYEIAQLSNRAMVVLVVGQLFDGTLAGAPVDTTPERRPPAVVERPDLTEPLVRQAQQEVPYRLLVPAVLERTSVPSRSAGVRVYSIAGRPTVRFTFVTGASEYWGIQVLRWNQAPALASPHRKVTLEGRRYDLHYVGPNLRTVVYRERGGTSYWVVNTLLNSLSNETMLAIAQGLRPPRE